MESEMTVSERDERMKRAADRLLKDALKPDEIVIGSPRREGRIDELVCWFERLCDRNANQKWLFAHAAELAYFAATRPSPDSAVRGALERCVRVFDALDSVIPDREFDHFEKYTVEFSGAAITELRALLKDARAALSNTGAGA